MSSDFDFKNQTFLGTIDVSVALDASYHGVKSQQLQVRHVDSTVECKACAGKSTLFKKCVHCDATGEIIDRICDKGTWRIQSKKCDICSGTGNAAIDCKNCVKTYEFEFSLEPGFPPGKIQRFQLKDRSANMNLRILTARHDLFQRVEDAPHHIATTFVLSLQQSFGLVPFSFELKHINGDLLKFTSEPGKIYRHGDIHRFVGKGLPVYRSGTAEKKPSFGDCIVVFEVKFPEHEWFEKVGQMDKLKTLFN